MKKVRIKTMPTGDVRKTLNPVPEHMANVEAEKGEVVVGDMNNDSLPELFKLGGKPHSQGGTPLNLPDQSFVFSQARSMKIKDENVLKEFMKSKPSTPADIAKKYDINEYRRILEDPNSDKIQIETAEAMIANYNIALGKLAIVQESMKGFPTGIPAIAMPYIESAQIDPSMFVGGEQIQDEAQQVAKYGCEVVKKLTKKMAKGGSLPKFDGGGETVDEMVARLKKQYGDDAQIFQTPDGSYGIWDDSKHDFIVKGLYPMGSGPASAPTTSTSSTTATASSSDGWDGLTPWTSKTAAGKTTPTGKNSDSKYKSAEERIAAYQKKGFQKAAQDELYDKSDAYARAIMWGIYGDTKAGGTGKKYEEWKPKDGETFSAYRKRMQSAGWTPEKLDAETKPLRPNFVDNKAGARETTLLNLLGYKEPEPAPVVAPKGAPSIHPNEFKGQVPDQFAPFWLQDEINVLGAVADRYRIKKYNPWNAQADPYIPDPVFLDPTRELAANAEGMKIGTDGAAMFGDPQSYNARFAQIQGQGARNAADTLSRIHNGNVGIANSFEGQRAGIINQSRQLKAQNDTNLYDKQTIANQQFDNAKAMSRQVIRQGVVDAITNRAQTQTLNSVYGKQYHIDPRDGGFLDFYNPKQMKPRNSEETLEKINKFKSQYPHLDFDKAIEKVVLHEIGLPASPYDDDAIQAIMEQQARTGAYNRR